MTSPPCLTAGDSNLLRSVFLLHRQLPARLAPLRSYVISTGSNRQSGGQDIAGSVDIAIVVRIARVAGPLARTQGHRLGDSPAGATCLRRRQPAIHNHQTPAVPPTLVLQHDPQLRPSGIGDRASQPMTATHVSYCQILDHDRLVLTNESSGQLVREVSAPISDPHTCLRHSDSSLLAVSTPDLLARQRPLSTGQPCPVSFLEFWIDDLLAGRERHQSRQAYVDSDSRLQLRQIPDSRILDKHRDEPTTRPVAGNCHRRRFSSIWQWPRPHDPQRVLALRQPQFPISIPKPRTSKLRRCFAAPPGLESRVSGLPAPEGHKSLLKMSQRLLERHAGHLVQPLDRRFTLPLSQHGRGLAIGDPAVLIGPSRCAFGQRPVVDIAHAPKRPIQQLSLLFVWVEAVLVRALRHAEQSRCAVRQSQRILSPPAAGHGVDPTPSPSVPQRKVAQ